MNKTYRTNIIKKIIGIEGGYVNDPRDSGGATRFGITEAVARKCGYDGKMCELPVEQAIQIYEGLYWQPLKLDDISKLSGHIAEELFDTGVNMSPSVAGKYLQRVLNVLNYVSEKISLYPDLVVDGQVGAKTISALQIYLNHRKQGESVVLKALNCLQGNKYIELAEKRKKDKAFINGWLINRVNI